MNRRQFVGSSAGAALAAVSPTSASAAAGPPVRMKLGCQSAPTNDSLRYLARYGVRNICGYPEIAGGRPVRHRR